MGSRIMRCLSKTYEHGNVVKLTTTIERDDVLIGYNMLGFAMYSKKIETHTFYGCTDYEVNRELAKFMNRPKSYRSAEKYERMIRFI